MTTSSPILSDRTNPIDQLTNHPNQLTKSILLKRRLCSAAKSKSYSDSPRFKRALTRIYAEMDWMVKQGYGFHGKDAYFSEMSKGGV